MAQGKLSKRKEYLCNMNEWIQVVGYYLIGINILTFMIYGIDKYKAKHSKWRVSEASLLLMAVVGGSIGALLGMRVWHHKTMHKKFKYGVPAILMIQIVLIGFAAFYLSIWQ